MIRRPPRSTHCISSAASDVYKRQVRNNRDCYGGTQRGDRWGRCLRGNNTTNGTIASAHLRPMARARVRVPQHRPPRLRRRGFTQPHAAGPTSRSEISSRRDIVAAPSDRPAPKRSSYPQAPLCCLAAAFAAPRLWYYYYYYYYCLLYTSPSPRDGLLSRMPSSA